MASYTITSTDAQEQGLNFVVESVNAARAAAGEELYAGNQAYFEARMQDVLNDYAKQYRQAQREAALRDDA
jgi:hypothetical protein